MCDFKVKGRQVKIGDFVRVSSTEGKRDGFIGVVKSVNLDCSTVTVVGASGKRAPSWRTVTIGRLSTISAERQAKLKAEHAERAAQLNLGPRPRRGRR